jgi:hypothetical protein
MLGALVVVVAGAVSRVLVGVQAHWYPVPETVVVTVIV